MTNIIIKRMWEGGPLRQFSDSPFNGSIPVVGGYAGRYVCDIWDHVCPDEGEEGGIKLCRGDGLVPDKWLCAPCGERHAHDKVSALRRNARLFDRAAENQPKTMLENRPIARNGRGHRNPSDELKTAGGRKCSFAQGLAAEAVN